MQTTCARNAPITSLIDEVIARVPGWTPADQLLALFTLACSPGAEGDILEIGSWCGRSTIILAHARRLAGSGRVQSVDLFPEKDDWFQHADGSWSFRTGQGEAYLEQRVWDEPYQNSIAPLYADYNGIYERMQDNLAHFGVADLVDCFRGTSDQYYAASEKRDFRMAFLDGDHSFEAVGRDIANVLDLMPKGGWVCFDDAFSTYEGVDRAIERHIWNMPRVAFAQQLTRKFHVARVVGKNHYPEHAAHV